MHPSVQYDNLHIFKSQKDFVSRRTMFEGLAIKEIFCEEAIKSILAIESSIARSKLPSMQKEHFLDIIGNNMQRLDKLKKISKFFLVKLDICGKNYDFEKRDHFERTKLLNEVNLMERIEKLEKKIDDLESILEEGPAKLEILKKKLALLKEEQLVTPISNIKIIKKNKEEPDDEEDGDIL